MQGLPWILRKVANFATVQLLMEQSLLPPTQNVGRPATPEDTPTTMIEVTQIISPGGFSSKDTYILDTMLREASVPLFGKIAVTIQYIPVSSIDDPTVRTRFEASGEPGTAILEVVKSVTNGWETSAFWGFEDINGKRYHTRNSITTKGDLSLKLRVVYDFIREL
ncbi:MAG: hypothetical protein Q9187_003341 [Circinaria calcarea]